MSSGFYNDHKVYLDSWHHRKQSEEEKVLSHLSQFPYSESAQQHVDHILPNRLELGVALLQQYVANGRSCQELIFIPAEWRSINE